MDIIVLLVIEFICKLTQLSLKESNKLIYNIITLCIWLIRCILSIVFLGGASTHSKNMKDRNSECKKDPPTLFYDRVLCSMAKSYVDAWEAEVAFIILYITFGLIVPIIVYKYAMKKCKI